MKICQAYPMTSPNTIVRTKKDEVTTQELLGFTYGLVEQDPLLIHHLHGLHLQVA